MVRGQDSLSFGYLKKWMRLARNEDTMETIKDLFIKEQFFNSCPKDLSAHLCDKGLVDLDEMATVAERFLIAHN